jgi:hypothetical protein
VCLRFDTIAIGLDLIQFDLIFLSYLSRKEYGLCPFNLLPSQSHGYWCRTLPKLMLFAVADQVALTSTMDGQLCQEKCEPPGTSVQEHMR